jgi:hypothetical protein
MVMKKLLGLLVLLAGAPAMGQPVFAGQYGVETAFQFVIWSSDGATLDGTQSDDGNDATIACGAGDETTTTNDYTDEGTRYRIVLSAAEMECSEQIFVRIGESVEAAFFVQTFGSASADIPVVAQSGDAYDYLTTNLGALGANATEAGGTGDHLTAIAVASIANNAITANAIATGAIDADAIAADAITSSELAASAVNELRDLVIEDQGGGVSLACALAVLLAYAAGDISTTGGATTYEDPSGNETRISGTVASAGNRTASITCPTF